MAVLRTFCFSIQLDGRVVMCTARGARLVARHSEKE